MTSAGELSDIANVPRSRSYDVLESLEKKGFVVMKLGKPIKYIAVPPAEVIERVKKTILEDAEKQSSVLENLKKSEVLNELNVIHKKGITHVDPVDLTGAVKGSTNLYSHLNSAIRNAEKQVSIITTEKGIIRKSTVLKNALSKAKNQGVKIKIAAPMTKNNKNAAKVLSAYGQVKKVDAVKTRFCVIDGKSVVIMAMDDTDIHPKYDFGVWINTEFMAKAFDNIFNMLWSKK
jgi:sugar-specific transcriptional regulator TrmB